jgi:hypothetical protein
MGKNIGSIVKGIILMCIAFILFPLIFTGAAGILSANTTNLTGVSTFTPIIPLLALVTLVFEGGMFVWGGMKGKSMSLKGIIAPIIVLSIALLLFPIIITQVNTLWDSAGTTYTGFRSFVAIIPMLLLVGLSIWGGVSAYSEYRGKGKKSSKRRRYA